MKIELPCEIVQDLLPSYIDELTSETTTESVAGHLETCVGCRKLWQNMKYGYGESGSGQDTAAGQPANAASDRDRETVDFLKKTRNRGRRAVICGILMTLALVFGALFLKVYCIGTPTSSYMISYNIEQNGGEDSFTFFGNLVDSGRGVEDVVWEEKGETLNLVVRSTAVSFFHPNSFSSCYIRNTSIHQVTINDSIVIWDDGTTISREVAQIYADMTPYVGSIEAIGKLCRDVGLSDVLAAQWTTELQTTTEPYGWILHLQGDFTEEVFAQYQEVLPRYVAVLLATIDNLGYMEFTCEVDGTEKSIRITEADADALLGAPVKSYIQSPKDLQQLVLTLGVTPSVFGSPMSMGPYVKDNFRFEVSNYCSEDIYGISIALEVNGTVIASQTVQAASHEPLDNDSIGYFTFVPEDQDLTIDMGKDQVNARITIYGQSPDLTDVKAILTLDLDTADAEYYDGQLYLREIGIEGDSASGFRIR